MVTPKMIEAGREILSPWHYHGEDAFVSIEGVVREIYKAMAEAEILPKRTS